jgi:hypothetical protein
VSDSPAAASVIDLNVADRLPPGMSPVAPWGLLSRVERACPEHGGDCPCVARNDDSGCLVFWCGRGEHHFSTRREAPAAA